MRYSSGQIKLIDNDLPATKAVGVSWGHTRTYANRLSNNGPNVGGSSVNGSSQLVRQMKYQSFVGAEPGDNNPGRIAVVNSSNSSLWFKPAPGTPGVYRSQFGGEQKLKHEAGPGSGPGQFVMTNARGKQTSFFDNSVGQPAALRGKVKEVKTKSGRVTSVGYNSAGNMTSVIQRGGPSSSTGQDLIPPTGYFYTYARVGAANLKALSDGSSEDEMLDTVTQEVNGQPVRRVRYTYYAEDDAWGSEGDLKSAIIERYNEGTGEWYAINRKHYRYYLDGNGPGFKHGLWIVIRGAAYQRMVLAGLDPETAPAETLMTFANYVFTYDTEKRVVSESLEGCQKVITYAYESNPTAPTMEQVNVWNTKTTETLPNGDVNRVYTNRAGQVIMKIFEKMLSGEPTGEKWYDYYQYNANFKWTFHATSSAVVSVTEPTPGSPNLVVVLKNSEGLIREQVFFTTSNPSTGAVEGLLEKKIVRKGVLGTPITVGSFEYDTREAFGESIYPLRATTVYPIAGGGPETGYRTSNVYTWHEEEGAVPTFQVKEKVTTHPVVTAAQNGSGVAGMTRQIYDKSGKLIWSMNQRGMITHQTYDESTSALVQRIEDVDTSKMEDVPVGWVTQPGWGAQLVSDYVNDALGRQVQARGPWHEVQLQECDTVTTPVRSVQFAAYQDAIHEVRRASGYMTGGGSPDSCFRTIGPVKVVQYDESGNLVQQFQAVRASCCGPLCSSEPLPQEKWVRWTVLLRDTWGRLVGTRAYFKIPVYGEGARDANYLATAFRYDVMGRVVRKENPDGTIERTVYEARGFPVSSWIGTDDTGATNQLPSAGTLDNNMVEVAQLEYDNGTSGGDGNLTKKTLPVAASDDRITSYAYDFRHRLETVTDTDGVTVWVSKTAYDNLDRAVEASRYHTSVAAGNLIARSRTFFDALGRVYRNEVDGVDVSTGAVTNTLTAQNWYDLAGNRIKASQMGSTAFTKTVFDSLNRPTTSYLACIPGTAGVPSGDDNNVSGDTVIEQGETVYDRGGNVILERRLQRFDDANGNGPLGNVNTEPKARITYTAQWPDAVGRIRNAADFGTNGAEAFVRPDVAPQRSDTVLVTTTRFKDDGDANATIDPMGIESRWENDHLGRRIRLVENYVPNCPDKSRISEYAWHPSGQLETLTLVNSVTGNQITRWIYGTTLYNSLVASNGLLRMKVYPESEDRPVETNWDGAQIPYCRVEFTYNRQGQATTFKDADDVTHSYLYDKLGRLISDMATVPQPAPWLDMSIFKITRTYEVRGMLQTVTSWGMPFEPFVRNEVKLEYDAFGNLVADKQAHSSEVTVDTPKVTYQYTDGSGNIMRPVSITYPNGRVVNYIYGTANSMSDHLNRITAKQVDGEGGDLVNYTYCGAAWQVRVAYPQPGIELTYKKQPGEPVGDSGDPYNGYDRFGRTQDIRWQTIDP